MSLLKSGISYNPVIISKMVFVCDSCGQIDIINEKDYSPNDEKKCSNCQSIMILNSTSTDVGNPLQFLNNTSNDISTDKISQE